MLSAATLAINNAKDNYMRIAGITLPNKHTRYALCALYGIGISREGSILDLATEMEIVQKSGTWFSYGKERIGQGREKARDFLKENRAMAEEIETKIRRPWLPDRRMPRPAKGFPPAPPTSPGTISRLRPPRESKHPKQGID